MFKNTLKWLKFFFPFVVTFIILLILFGKFDIDKLYTTLKQGKKILIIFSFFLLLLTTPILTLRWNILLKSIGHKIPTKKLFFFFLASVPISKTSPSNSGDFVRAYYLKDLVPISQNLGIILIEALSDIFVLSFLSLLGGIIIKNIIAIYLSVFTLFSITLLFFTTKYFKFQNKKWKNKLDNFLKIFHEIKKNKLTILQLLLLSLSSWLVVFIFVTTLFRGLGANVNLLDVITIQPIATIAGLLPITFSGVGVRETSMLYLFNGLANSAIILSTGLIYSFFTAILFPIICLPFTFRVIRHKINKKQVYEK